MGKSSLRDQKGMTIVSVLMGASILMMSIMALFQALGSQIASEAGFRRSDLSREVIRAVDMALSVPLVCKDAFSPPLSLPAGLVQGNRVNVPSFRIRQVNNNVLGGVIYQVGNPIILGNTTMTLASASLTYTGDNLGAGLAPGSERRVFSLVLSFADPNLNSVGLKAFARTMALWIETAGGGAVTDCGTTVPSSAPPAGPPPGSILGVGYLAITDCNDPTGPTNWTALGEPFALKIYSWCTPPFIGCPNGFHYKDYTTNWTNTAPTCPAGYRRISLGTRYEGTGCYSTYSCMKD